MECPRCHEERPRKTSGSKNWSDTQWARWNPIAALSSGQLFNCCRYCSSECFIHPSAGEPGPDPSSAPTPATYPAHPAFREAVRDLQRIVPPDFWFTFRWRCLHHARDPANHVRITAECALQGWSTNMSGIKFLSYYGGVSCRGEIPPCYICPHTGSEFFDPTNRVYNALFRLVWPTSVPNITNDETVGDLIEALLGFAYIQRVQYPAWWGSAQRAVVETLDFVIFEMYKHTHGMVFL